MSKTTPQEEKTFFKKFSRVAKTIIGGILCPFTISFKKDASGKRRLKFHSSILRVASFFVAYWVVQPFTVFLFPRAEDVLQKEGLDPRIVRNLTDAPDVRIIPNTWAGKLYLLTSAPHPSQLLLWPRMTYEIASSIFDDEVRGFFSVRHREAPVLKLFSCGASPVFVKDAAAEINTIAKANKEAVENNTDDGYTLVPLVTGETEQRHTLLHEIRHTSSENRLLTNFFREADADYNSILQLSNEGKDTIALKKMLLKQSMFNFDKDHNTALYLWHKFNNVAMPSEEDICEANEEAAPFVDMLTDINLLKCRGGFSNLGKIDTDRLMIVFNKECEKLSPLARQRVRLAEEGWNNHLVEIKTHKAENAFM